MSDGINRALEIPASSSREESTRYGTGRGVAFFLGWIGWLCVVVAPIFLLIFLLVSSYDENPSMGYFFTMGGIASGYLGGGLFMVGIAHVMNAIFDLADNSFES